MYDDVILTLTTSRKIIRDQLVSSRVYCKILVSVLRFEVACVLAEFIYGRCLVV